MVYAGGREDVTPGDYLALRSLVLQDGRCTATWLKGGQKETSAPGINMRFSLRVVLMVSTSKVALVFWCEPGL